MKKQAVLFLSDKSNQYAMDRFTSLEEVENDKYDVYYLYHNKNNYIPAEIQNIKNFCFESSILHTLGYVPIKNELLPGSNHFPLLYFFSNIITTVSTGLLKMTWFLLVSGTYYLMLSKTAMPTSSLHI